jgi:hypothetical protein
MISTEYSYSRMIGRVSGNNPEGKLSRHKTYDNVWLFPVGKKNNNTGIHVFKHTRPYHEGGCKSSKNSM